jgi:hypothetical protein
LERSEESCKSGDGSRKKIHVNGHVNIGLLISNAELQTTNYKLQTATMEVHHHPNVEKKNFKEYFLEFLMIFLAVTMGFIAENVREGISESRIQKEYVKSFVDDLKEDVLEFDKIIPFEQTSINGIDTMLNTLNNAPYSDSSMRLLYYLFRKYTMAITPMEYTLRTITQLKYSGGLRLITDKKASDSIIAYNKTVDGITQILDYTTHDFMIPSVKVGNNIFKPEFLLPYDGWTVINLLHSGKKTSLQPGNEIRIPEYTNLIYEVKQIRQNYLGQLKWHEERAKDMIAFFQKEYRLENE